MSQAISWWRRLLILVGACAVASLIGALVDPQQFFQSYLLGYFGWFSIALGSLALQMIHHLSGGAWGLAIRPILLAAVRTMPLLALLFLPIALGVTWLYPWTDGEHLQKAAYLNVPFFLGRAAAYFVIWNVLAYCVCECDETTAPSICAPGLVVLGVTATFAAIDWIMSLEPSWSSTIFGALVATGQMLPALALAIVVATCLIGRRPDVSADVWNDLGNLLLAFVMLWTYMAFSQFLLIWSGNLPEEITWYLARNVGGWNWIALALGLLYFAIPFLLLLSRGRKRAPQQLRRVALLLLAMSFINQFWMIVPAFSPGRFAIHWMDVAEWIAIGGAWVAMFLRNLQSRSLAVVCAADGTKENTQHA